MEKYITDKRTGLKYELVGDYYLIAGVLSLTKNLAIQYYGTGIRVNSVSPGSTDTPLFAPENFVGVDEEMMVLTARSHVRTIDHMLSPYEQAYAILFLASGINGQDLVVDYGGRL